MAGCRTKLYDVRVCHIVGPLHRCAAIGRRDLDGAARLVPDEAVEAFGVAGTPRQCRDKVAAFAQAGLDEVVLLMTGDEADRSFGLSCIAELIR